MKALTLPKPHSNLELRIRPGNPICGLQNLRQARHVNAAASVLIIRPEGLPRRKALFSFGVHGVLLMV